MFAVFTLPSQKNYGQTMKVNNGKHEVKAVTYELYVDMDGEPTMVEECTAERPFRFITGVGYTFDAFETALQPLAVGDRFDFVVKAEEANGPRDEEYVFDVDKAIFSVDGSFPNDEVYPGAVVPLLDADGNRLQATVVAVKKDKVTIDLNHPLAGKDLHFVGMLIEARPATDEELRRLTSGCCGCHGGSCEGGKCEDGTCDNNSCCEGGKCC